MFTFAAVKLPIKASDYLQTYKSGSFHGRFIHFKLSNKSMNTHTHTISFNPDGTALCLWTEAVPLRELGQLEITRATNIEFNNERQQWEVREPAGALLYSALSRNACLT